MVKQLIKYTMFFVAGSIVSLVFVWAGFYAMEREDQKYDELRRERCAALGENPGVYSEYCADIQG